MCRRIEVAVKLKFLILLRVLIKIKYSAHQIPGYALTIVMATTERNLLVAQTMWLGRHGPSSVEAIGRITRLWRGYKVWGY
jgi:hypothetical protein